MGLEAATLMAIGTGVSTAATFAAAEGTKDVGRYNKQIADRNALVSEQKAEMALFDASREAVKFRNDFRALNDYSAMSMRKNNVAISGTALDVLLDNALNFEIDNQNELLQNLEDVYSLSMEKDREIDELEKTISKIEYIYTNKSIDRESEILEKDKLIEDPFE